jgi:hypothetical protein
LAPNARLEKIIAEMRAEARDASADGEDMSVMRGWANDLAKLARSLAQHPAAPAAVDEAIVDYRTHHDDFRVACLVAQAHAPNDTDRRYWQHQVDVLDRIAALTKEPS